MVTLIIFAVVFFLFTLESRCTMLNSYPCTRSWPRRGWAGRAPSCVSASSPRVPCLTTRRPASCGAFCCPCDTRERDQKRRWDREAKAARPRLDSDAFTSKSSKHRATYTTFWDSERAVCHTSATSQAYHAVCHSHGSRPRRALSPTHPARVQVPCTGPPTGVSSPPLAPWSRQTSAVGFRAVGPPRERAWRPGAAAPARGGAARALFRCEALPRSPCHYCFLCGSYGHTRPEVSNELHLFDQRAVSQRELDPKLDLVGAAVLELHGRARRAHNLNAAAQPQDRGHDLLERRVRDRHVERAVRLVVVVVVVVVIRLDGDYVACGRCGFQR